MRIASEARRLTYLVHRWTGVAGCLLMVLWFVSGMVMLFVGYPKLTPAERLRTLPSLTQSDCCAPLPMVLTQVSKPDALRSITLTSVLGEPRYILQEDNGIYRVFNARNGRPVPMVDTRAAAAQAQRFLPAAPVLGQRLIDEDRWTHSRALDPHRPLHAVQLGGKMPATLYVSSATGEVVMDAPRAQQRWNYVGAWLHWLYMFRDRPVDPGWSWLVIILSAAGTLTALTGACVGIWRWRFKGRYKSGSRSPYRASWMKWHHVVGLLFAGFVCTWIFSGLMSMNPLGMFDPRHGRPDLAAYRGGSLSSFLPEGNPASAIKLLRASGFVPVELSWRMIGGQPYLLAFDAKADTRLVLRRPDSRSNGPVLPTRDTGKAAMLPGGTDSEVLAMDDGLLLRKAWPADAVLHAAQALFPWPITDHAIVQREDAYYYGRHAQAMNGAADRRLPALRLDFADPDATRSYVNLRSGDVVLSLAWSARVGRWLFYFLHSWDIPWLLGLGGWRDALLIMLSLGGTAVSLTGVVIGISRLRIWARHRFARQAANVRNP